MLKILYSLSLNKLFYLKLIEISIYCWFDAIDNNLVVLGVPVLYLSCKCYKFSRISSLVVVPGFGGLSFLLFRFHLVLDLSYFGGNVRS